MRLRMRFRFTRLVYVLIGATLGVGLLVSALVQPQPTLAASQTCYGVCPSVTTIRCLLNGHLRQRRGPDVHS